MYSGKKSGPGVRTSTMLFESKCVSPGVRNSTMQSSNYRRNFFDSMIHMKSFGSEIKAHFFSIFLFSKLNDANQVKKPRLEFQTKKIRKKVRLEFGTKQFHVNHRIKEIAPVTRTLHR